MVLGTRHSVPVQDAGHGERLVTLFTTNALDARVRSAKPQPVIDQSTQQHIGTAQRLSRPTKSRGFWLRDREGQVFIHVVKDLVRPTTWRVLSAQEDEVGLIVGAAWRETWRWQLGSRLPARFIGRVLVDNRDVAYIREGSVVDALTHLPVAAVPHIPGSSSLGPSKSSETWTLRIADGLDGPLRKMALAWLSIAADLRFNAENSG